MVRGTAHRQLGKGVSTRRIAEFIALRPQPIRKIGRYSGGGLEAPYAKERPGASTLLIRDLKALAQEVRAWNRETNRRASRSTENPRKRAREKLDYKRKSIGQSEN